VRHCGSVCARMRHDAADWRRSCHFASRCVYAYVCESVCAEYVYACVRGCVREGIHDIYM